MNEEDRRTWRKRFELKKRSKTIKKSARKQARKVEGATVRHARRFLVDRWDKIREVRLRIIFWLAGVGLLICVVGLQMVWFQQSYVTTAGVSGGTYAEAVRGPVQTLNPLYAASPAEHSASRLIFSSLFRRDTTGHLKGDLAQTMTNKKDQTYTVKLRHDANWHDGEPVTAKDVVFTVDLMQNTSARSVMTASWQGIDVKQIDDYTVQFELPAAYAAFPQALTFGILPEHILHSVDPASLRESVFSSKPVGSGPFSFQLLQTIDQTTKRKIVYLNANESYYDGAPRLDRLQLHIYNDDATLSQSLRTGEVTGASDVPSSMIQTLDKGRYTVVVRPINSGVYALFNLTNPLLEDKNIRKALSLATDTQSIREQIYGNPRPLHLPFVKGQVAGADAISVPKPDISSAEKLLERKGWTMKDGVRTKGKEKLRLRIVTRKNNDYEKVLSALASQWRDLGVQVDAVVFDTTDTSKSYTNDILQTRDYDVLLDELVIGGDPDVFAFWHSRGLLNFSEYGNGTSDDALSSARTTSDEKLRDVKYTAFARQWLSDIPAIGIYQSNYFYVRTKGTRAVELTEKVVSPSEHYADVRYWTAEQGRVYKTP